MKPITRATLKSVTPLEACQLAERALHHGDAYYLMVSTNPSTKTSVGLGEVLKAAIRNGEKEQRRALRDWCPHCGGTI